MATRMQQRRGTEAQWESANPVLAAGEIGFEIDTNKFKIGDGINQWDDLSYFLDTSDLDLSGALADYVQESRIGAALGVASLDADGQVPLSQLGLIIADAPAILDNLEEIATAINSTTGLVQQRIDLSLEPVIESIEDGFESTGLSITAIEGDVSDLTNSTGLLSSSVTQLETDLSTAQGDIVAVASDVSNLESALATAEGNITLVTSDLSALTTVVDDNYTTLTNNLGSHATDTTNVHGIADTSVLVTTTELALKQDKVSTVSDTEISYLGGTTPVTSNVQAQLNGKASSSHTHAISDVTDLQTALDAKASLAGAVFTGDVTVETDLTIEGNLTVSGTTTTIDVTDLSVSDPLIYLASGQYAEDVLDVGFLAATGVVGGTEGSHLHSGFFRDVSDSKKWKLVSNVPHPVSNVVDTTNATRETLVVGNLEATGVVFSDGTQTKQGVPSITTISAKTDSYTLSNLNERDTIVEISKGSATTLTIPTNSSVAYPVGTTIDIIQTGSGQVTIAGAGGVTVNATPGLKLRTQWSSATLLKRAENTWLVYGDLSA
jgi:hypothetical protein